jgi:glycine dehydrogenase subunit 2
MNNQGRPTQASVPVQPSNRGLMLEEGLVFEQGQVGRCGVDFPDVVVSLDRLGGLLRVEPSGATLHALEPKEFWH